MPVRKRMPGGGVTAGRNLRSGAYLAFPCNVFLAENRQRHPVGFADSSQKNQKRQRVILPLPSDGGFSV